MRAWLLLAADRLIEAAPMLTELDARIGDGDHGINLARGMVRVREALAAADPAPAADDLRLAGRTLVSTVGGASGPLYGTFFLEAASALAASTDASLARALRAGADGVARRGRSTTGQKTMLDALVPAIEALEERLASGADLARATALAASAADAGCEATRELVAQRGRASYLGERSRGHLDPGAVSSRILVESLAVATAQADGPASGAAAGKAMPGSSSARDASR